MPYIKETDRILLDKQVEEMILAFRCSFKNQPCKQDSLTDEEFILLLGKINYCFSRILSSLMGKPSYSKIAMITGVLENIKQEFYRRVGVNLEDKKILENGDIREYGKLQ